MEENYRKAFSEVSEVLKAMPDNLLKKIPNKFIDIVEKEKLDNYKIRLYDNIEEQVFSEEATIILGIIYKDFLCDENERNQLEIIDNEKIRIYEDELRAKFNPDNIFNINEEEKKLNSDIFDLKEENMSQNFLIEYKEQTFLMKIFEKIKNLFKRKKQ
ncbi:MAG TPA: hypothetical protein PK993_02060 [Clostridia bacterium]|nr:hypothetical protein [Clostridia bacterium]